MIWCVTTIALLAFFARLGKRRIENELAIRTRCPGDQSPCGLIVVLGCPPAALSGGVNRYFLGRVHATLQLAAEVPRAQILCTGGIDSRGEASVLRASLIRQGIAPSRVEIDSTSARTIDSIDFLARSDRRQSVCFVSQPFHLPRVIYLASRRGLQASAWPALGPAVGWRLRTREALATLRSVFEVNVSRR